MANAPLPMRIQGFAQPALPFFRRSSSRGSASRRRGFIPNWVEAGRKIGLYHAARAAKVERAGVSEVEDGCRFLAVKNACAGNSVAVLMGALPVTLWLHRRHAQSYSNPTV